MIKNRIRRALLRRVASVSLTPDRPAVGTGPIPGSPWYGPAVILVIVVLILAAVLAALGKHPNVIISLLASAGAIGVSIAVSLRVAASRLVKVEIA